MESFSIKLWVQHFTVIVRKYLFSNANHFTKYSGIIPKTSTFFFLGLTWIPTFGYQWSQELIDSAKAENRPKPVKGWSYSQHEGKQTQVEAVAATWQGPFCLFQLGSGFLPRIKWAQRGRLSSPQLRHRAPQALSPRWPQAAWKFCCSR